ENTKAKTKTKTNDDSDAAEPHSPSKPVTRFVPPTLDEVTAYCQERGNNVDPQSFIDHYQTNGWMRGKNKIKDWKSCIRTWESSAKSGYKQDGNSN
ncbi:hypothetical protein SMA90_30965, partial [Escherichia coli]